MTNNCLSTLRASVRVREMCLYPWADKRREKKRKRNRNREREKEMNIKEGKERSRTGRLMCEGSVKKQINEEKYKRNEKT